MATTPKASEKSALPAKQPIASKKVVAPKEITQELPSTLEEPAKGFFAKLPTPFNAMETRQVPWSGWVGVVYAVVLFFSAQVLASFVVLPYLWITHYSRAAAEVWLTNSVVAQFWFVLTAEALTLGGIIWFLRRRKSNLRTIGLKPLEARDAGYAILGLIGYYVVYLLLLSVLSHLIPSLNVNQQQDTGFQNAAGSSNLLLTFISLVILPPFVEEVVFRGFVFSGLKNKLPIVWSALLTSLLFGAAHLQFGSGNPLLWVAGIDTFTLSIVLCYLRQRTGSIWAGIFVHSLKNSVAFFVLFIVPIIQLHAF